MARTILIVDDEPQLLRLLVRVLERGGFEVLSAESGDSALEQIEARGKDIAAVVLDVLIPPRGAAEVLDRLALLAPEAGVVLVSGDEPEDPLRDRVDGSGGTFLRKPFLPERLLEAVRAVCDGATRGSGQ